MIQTSLPFRMTADPWVPPLRPQWPKYMLYRGTAVWEKSGRKLTGLAHRQLAEMLAFAMLRFSGALGSGEWDSKFQAGLPLPTPLELSGPLPRTTSSSHEKGITHREPTFAGFFGAAKLSYLNSLKIIPRDSRGQPTIKLQKQISSKKPVNPTDSSRPRCDGRSCPQRGENFPPRCFDKSTLLAYTNESAKSALDVHIPVVVLVYGQLRTFFLHDQQLRNLFPQRALTFMHTWDGSLGLTHCGHGSSNERARDVLSQWNSWFSASIVEDMKAVDDRLGVNFTEDAATLIRNNGVAAWRKTIMIHFIHQLDTLHKMAKNATSSMENMRQDKALIVRWRPDALAPAELVDRVLQLSAHYLESNPYSVMVMHPSKDKIRARPDFWASRPRFGETKVPIPESLRTSRHVAGADPETLGSDDDYWNYYRPIAHCDIIGQHNAFWDTFFVTTSAALDDLNLTATLSPVYDRRDSLCYLMSSARTKIVWLPVHQNDFMSLVRCGPDKCKGNNCYLKPLFSEGTPVGTGNQNAYWDDSPEAPDGDYVCPS